MEHFEANEIKKAIEALRSAKPVYVGEYLGYVHPKRYFAIVYEDLCTQAYNLNTGGHSIWDKRTKGYKLIKETWTKYLSTMK